MCVCEIGDGGTYRYLGVSQLLKADLQKMKGAVKAEYKRREQKIWGIRAESELNGRQARGQPTTRGYFFGAVEWNITSFKYIQWVSSCIRPKFTSDPKPNVCISYQLAII